MREDSQVSKAATLHTLCKQLHQALERPAHIPSHSPSTSTRDFSHVLLQLLASLSGQPLSSVLHETPELLELLYKAVPSAAGQGQHVPRPLRQEQRQWQQQRRRREQQQGWKQGGASDLSGADSSDQDQGEEDEEYDPFGSDSELSDWDSSDGSPREGQPAAADGCADSGLPVTGECAYGSMLRVWNFRV